MDGRSGFIRCFFLRGSFAKNSIKGGFYLRNHNIYQMLVFACLGIGISIDQGG